MSTGRSCPLPSDRIKSQTNRTRRCTCSDPPLIDLSEVPHFDKSNDSLTSKIREACASHGCFYIKTVFERSKYGIAWSETQEYLQKMFDYYARENSKNDLVIYRGRDAESGSASAVGRGNAEPKQSLEYQRRFLAQVSKTNIEGVVSIELEYERIIRTWTTFLHDIARTIKCLLGLPSDILADDNHSDSIDLLRVFRYDPVLPSSDKLGSSAHTDWGSMTIVHTDMIGLQRCCTSCGDEKWIDVPPLHCDLEEELQTVSLFVHIGDFMSLAIKGRWLSPRHRVVCPSILMRAQPRFSLVYFVYPKHGITLQDARYIFCSTEKEIECDNSLTDDECNHYSVLQNQHPDNVESFSASDVLKSYLTVPFEEVMAMKWKQVQRNM